MKNGRKKKEKKFGGRKQIYKKEETQTGIKNKFEERKKEGFSKKTITQKRKKRLQYEKKRNIILQLVDEKTFKSKAAKQRNNENILQRSKYMQNEDRNKE